ncbi:hypothetical protein SAPIO_CDS9660 [Scedosporium apiospermum]|uniref:Ilp is an apoptosis inhibitor n=1 Tax=Pseudallescheria apiosperma TaxID=563466 RepID=A0A084FX94_PSEDA|nr:uncharacterized protein SAPIO_CDS9660 [Scedosporium apiospermum]KEZ39706.1 hypothetical protein SAPIO_CDS9660 [Scedosporium apiospermum]
MAVPGGSQQQFHQGTQFDLFEWHPKFQSCLRYFLDEAQYTPPVQVVASFINIQLPFQHPIHPVYSYSPTVGAPGPAATPRPAALGPAPAKRALVPVNVTLIPYVRRLIVTGFDFPAVLHGFFGDDWAEGIGPIHETERKNYLFAAKSENWLKVKADYDMADGQYVPFLKPLQEVTEKEIQSAEATWSEWLAMQDWMLGPRAPDITRASGVHIKQERRQ